MKSTSLILFLALAFASPGRALSVIEEVGRTSKGCKVKVPVPERWKRGRPGYFFLAPTGVVPVQGEVDPQGGELAITLDPVAPDPARESTREKLMSLMIRHSNGTAKVETPGDLEGAVLISYQEGGRYSSIRTAIAVLFDRCGSNVMFRLRYGKNADVQGMMRMLRRVVREIQIIDRFPP